MKALGIGVRVYVEWTGDVECPGLTCQTGTIIDGPFPAGGPSPMRPDYSHLRFTSWRVLLDGGEDVTAAERCLTPIDHDPDTQLTEQREEQVNA